MDIVHTRIDYRLIHGQVITKWLKVCGAEKIVIVDDSLVKDSFLTMVYRMAAPTGIEVIITSCEDFQKAKNDLEGKVLLLFKTIDMALKTVQDGLDISALQVGGLENTAGRKIVHNQISMDMNDYEKLKEIENKGIKVYFQTVPGEEESDLEKVRKKL
ncbi:MAG: PTS sugar transporter subunit IIB [Erysipelotrichaceae bacterium]|nr:PTS sugar transporter subunit IIB [Erysipelotrichaceae bacterium]